MAGSATKKTMLKLLAVAMVGYASWSIVQQEKSPSQNADKVITLRLSENLTDSNPTTVAMRKFASLVEEKTNGSVRVKVYANAQLGQGTESIEQVRLGVVDFARVNSVILSNVSPSIGVFTLPYIFKDSRHSRKVLDGPVGSDVLKDLEDYNLTAFHYMEAGFRSFYTRQGITINKLADLKGLKIRVQPSPISIRMVELLGGVPTPMNYGEVYSAIQTGVIDGAENDHVSYIMSGHYEVAPIYSEDKHLSPPAILIMNHTKFNSLSDAHQQAIREASFESAAFQRGLMDQGAADAIVKLKAAGVTITPLDNAPFAEAVKPIYDEYPAYKKLIERIRNID